jgi:hypothetical protein
VRELVALVHASGSTLDRRCGLSTRSVAELLAEVGDPRRFTEGRFARVSGSAPLPASTAEGPGEPIRHRYNPGGNRRVNAILHRMAVTQLRCELRAQALYAQGPRPRPHQEEGPPRTQAPPQRRHPPPHDARPRAPALVTEQTARGGDGGQGGAPHRTNDLDGESPPRAKLENEGLT